jgi:hypothetical protein
MDQIIKQLDGFDGRVIRKNARVDALVVDGGGNDMGFAKVIKDCAFKYEPCYRTFSIPGVIADGYEALTGRPHPDLVARDPVERRHHLCGSTHKPPCYRKLAARVKRFVKDHRVRKVLLLEYSDPMRDDRGGWATFPGMLSGLTAPEAKFANDKLLVHLNRALADLASRAGSPWVYVSGTAEASKFHGYPSTFPWFHGPTESLQIQGDVSGSMHPNLLGTESVAHILVPHMVSALAGVPRGVKARVRTTFGRRAGRITRG